MKCPNPLRIGQLTSFNEEYEDYTVDFLSPVGISPQFVYYFPTPHFIRNISKHEVVRLLETPRIRPGRRIRYEFSALDLGN